MSKNLICKGILILQAQSNFKYYLISLMIIIMVVVYDLKFRHSHIYMHLPEYRFAVHMDINIQSSCHVCPFFNLRAKLLLKMCKCVVLKAFSMMSVSM